MKAATIRRALREAGSWDAAVAMGRQEIAHRDAIASQYCWEPGVLAESRALRQANKQISRALAGFAAPEFWAESTDDEDVSTAFRLYDQLKQKEEQR